MAEKKKRILYIDALRGFCMILIIMNHCHFTFFSNEIGQLLVNTRVPFFFFLSGLFFKRYGCFKEFCVKKLNQLVVPYFFFSYIPFCLFTYFYTDRYADPLFYLTASIKPWNTPLWFLRALLFAHFFYYFIDKLEKKSAWLQVLMIAVMVIVTFELNIGFKKVTGLLYRGDSTLGKKSGKWPLKSQMLTQLRNNCFIRKLFFDPMFFHFTCYKKSRCKYIDYFFTILYISDFHLFVNIRNILFHLLVCLAKVADSTTGMKNRGMVLVSAIRADDR